MGFLGASQHPEFERGLMECTPQVKKLTKMMALPLSSPAGIYSINCLVCF
jgi:hypothetical protein